MHYLNVIKTILNNQLIDFFLLKFKPDCNDEKKLRKIITFYRFDMQMI